MKYKDDPNYEKWLKDFHSHQETYPYTFTGYDEAIVYFWHSDENRPFLTVAVDTMVLYDNGCVQIFSRDYAEPIITIWEWDYWKIEAKEPVYEDKLHASHKSVRSSDASTFDFICDDCGATDCVTGGWGTLRKSCKGENNVSI
jgi:hypothetical protein